MKNSPSETLMSKLLYMSWTEVLPIAHLYRPESDFVMFVMVTDRISCPDDVVSTLRLYLPLSAVAPSVSISKSSASHWFLQKNLLLADGVNKQ